MNRARRPDLFLVGAPKSGTTSLYEYLGGHPDIFMSSVKEPGYFCTDIRVSRRARFEYGIDEARYLQLFAGAGDALHAGEASTRYMVSPRAPELVREFSPDAVIVAALRNPVDMIHALHNERVSNVNEDITDFAAALAAEGDRRVGKRLPGGANPLGAVYREHGRYAEQLERWFGAFGRERVHVIVFDDFVSDTPAVFRGLLTFLGVDPDYQPPSFAVHNPSHRQRRLVRRLGDSRFGRLLTTHLLVALVGETRRRRIAKRFRQSSLSRAQIERAPLPADLRRSLETEFEPDVERLSQMLDRDLGKLWFGRPALPAVS